MLAFSSTAHYWNKYIDKRDFADLNKVNLENAVDAKILDNQLSGLKWITPSYPKNPKEEILKLQEVINIIKKARCRSSWYLFNENFLLIMS